MPNKALRETAMAEKVGLRLSVRQKAKLADVAGRARVPMAEILRQVLDRIQAGTVQLDLTGGAPFRGESTWLGVALTVDQKTALAALAEEAEVTMSDVMRRIIDSLETAQLQIHLVGEGNTE